MLMGPHFCRQGLRVKETGPRGCLILEFLDAPSWLHSCGQKRSDTICEALDALCRKSLKHNFADFIKMAAIRQIATDPNFAADSAMVDWTDIPRSSRASTISGVRQSSTAAFVPRWATYDRRPGLHCLAAQAKPSRHDKTIVVQPCSHPMPPPFLEKVRKN